MSTFEQLILDSSTLSVGATLEKHLNNLGNGTGTGDPYPVPVIMSGVMNIGLSGEVDVGILETKAKVSILDKNKGVATKIGNSGGQ